MMQIQCRQTYTAPQEAAGHDKKASCAIVVHAVALDRRSHKQCLFAGRDDGSIVAWTMESVAANDKPWASFFVKKGCGLKSMVYVVDYSVLITGSADGNMTIWDPWRKSTALNGDSESFHCIQQIVGHTSSVTDITYLDDCIISCSTDQTIKVWKVDDGRELLQYPWFKCEQTIKMDCWPTAASGSVLRGVDKRQIFVGTTDGALHKFESTDHPTVTHSRSGTPAGGGAGTGGGRQSARAAIQFEKSPIGGKVSGGAQRASRQMHALGITSLLLIPPENLLVSLGYDQVVKVVETESLATLFTAANPTGKYTGLAWNSHLRALFLTDEAGHVSAYNVFSGKQLKEERVMSPLQQLRGVSIVPGSQRLMLVDKARATVWSIEQQQLQGQDNFDGHEGPVISVTAVETDAREEHLLYTASEDNTIRCYDPYDNHCLRTYKDNKDDISCAIYNAQYKYIISGHDSGALKIWNPDSGSFIKLAGHGNTISCLVVGLEVKGDRHLITADYDGRCAAPSHAPPPP